MARVKLLWCAGSRSWSSAGILRLLVRATGPAAATAALLLLAGRVGRVLRRLCGVCGCSS